ncbi:MAG TPA: alanine--tRNA ligase [Acidimicrobiales bacterium]|nr:alanine--tRNA ligase [Acidimicrobiales bacterium]
MTADELRRAFTGFFTERGHVPLPSSGLIPHHPAAPLFTNAGMNQFLPYILGEEAPPSPRVTTVQKCVRIRGKHDDIANIGVTWGHLTFFEMLGNFSFGDYFKEQAIPYAWELLTEVCGIDPDRMWVTVHETDDEGAQIWLDAVGLPAERLQRMTDDNFWEMGETGPCGPCSEIYFDKGEEFGEGGGPAHGAAARFREIWNLVFMQYDRQPDGSLVGLPMRIIDTGAGLERCLTVLQGVDSAFDTDVLRPIVDAAAATTGRRYGADPDIDVSLRILADHARSMSFLVSDGVFPSNEDRGYVLRRIIRRAVRHAFGLGVDQPVTPALVDATVEVMGGAYPKLAEDRDFVAGVVAREEERFRQTLRSGSAILDTELTEVAARGGRLAGDVAFRLHDTFGFPLELTLELAAERGVDVDVDGFTAEMEAQRRRAREAAGAGAAGMDAARLAAYRELVEQFGLTEFTGYVETESTARVLAVLDGEGPGGTVEVFLDRTPFYAEAGGQVGDTGTITTETGELEVLDTTSAVPGLHRHTARLVSGRVTAGQEARAAVDAERREAIKRNHTGTHILHGVLREVLGPHVKQAGSLVAPDRLRFDFSHYEPLTPEELVRIEDIANSRVLANEPVRAYETTRPEAERVGAIAFFGEKYGDVVRVVEAGSKSVELCGGTHVPALGTIGPIKIVSEGSIGANLRRIEAVTGTGSLERIRHEENILGRTATLLRVAPPEVPERVERVLDENRSLAEQLAALRRAQAGAQAEAMAAAAVDGVVVSRLPDGTDRKDLETVAAAVRDQPGVRGVVLAAAPPGGGVALVALVRKDSGLVASDLLTEAARTVGGGVGRNPERAVAGGRDPSRLDEALEQVRKAVAAAGEAGSRAERA